MELNDFVALFAAQFDETPNEQFSAGKKFRDFDEWSSLTALSIIAMVDDEFDVQLNGDDIRNSTTIEDVFNTVKSKLDGA